MTSVTVPGEDDVILRRANEDLDKANLVFEAIEERSEAYSRATYESARRVDQWTKELIERGAAYALEFAHKIDELNESLSREEEKEKMELRTIDENKREVELISQDVAELESIVAELKISKDALPNQERRLRDVLKDSKARLRDREEQVRHVEERLEHGISHLQKTINEYQDALGLKMNIVDDGHIRFTFACIDPQKPQVKYIVEVGREGTDKLIAVACEPMVKRFRELKEKLNCDGQLVAFLRDIRQEFQALVA